MPGTSIKSQNQHSEKGGCNHTIAPPLDLLCHIPGLTNWEGLQLRKKTQPNIFDDAGKKKDTAMHIITLMKDNNEIMLSSKCSSLMAASFKINGHPASRIRYSINSPIAW
ncbi:hypothetical protein Y1Q_0019117 [Alligator mississippiensis]|uniref:Uncharacterized protein n=1 Tax=Alligator mississippiensis TaxID=8496 RepID=A0A151MQ79_ALLMI|nr:hypothetical protein Y1Q_0019117 [Alligator mississippiensis]